MRWAALLHDIGKPEVFSLDENGQGHFRGHAQAGAQLADRILRELRAPNALREQAAENGPIQLQLGAVRGEEALESGYLI